MPVFVRVGIGVDATSWVQFLTEIVFACLTDQRGGPQKVNHDARKQTCKQCKQNSQLTSCEGSHGIDLTYPISSLLVHPRQQHGFQPEQCFTSWFTNQRRKGNGENERQQ